MATLKGQNFRVYTWDATASKYKVVGLASNCTINLNTNSEDVSSKDDVGLASKPEIISKSWSVSVDSFSMADVGTLLTAMKNMSQFTLMWDETSTTDNQTRQKATFARKGTAYLNDATFTFNDRTNATKSLQFTGCAPLETVGSSEASEVIALGSYTKGQYVRLFLSSDNTTTPTAVIASSKSLSLHCSLTLEDSSTKDTTGDFQVQEPTGLSYDISTNALVRSGETITSAVSGYDLTTLETIYEAGLPVKWQIANTSGDNNRTKGSVLVSGSAALTQLSVSAAVKSNTVFDAQLNGYGEYTVGS